MKNKLAINLFSSGLQAISLQLLGGLFFYFISVYISKSDFGIINWTNSVSIFITILIGFGMEQVVVRRIAASKRSDWTAVVFFIHSLIGFLVAFFLLLLVNSMPGNHLGIYKVLPWFFLAQGLVFIGVPLKQLLNAKEKFTPYGIIALVSNVSRILLAWIFVSKGILSIHTVLLIMTGAAAFELISLLVYILVKEKLTIRLRFGAYFKLLKESSAQYVSVIFDMSLSRMDWILLGIMTSNVTLADYSIAYRSYELARLPLFIIAPMILPKFSRLLALNQKLDTGQQQAVAYFNQTEMFAAVLIALALNILWVPVVGYITHGKYGESNALEFMILSCCLPLQFMINLFWTLGFSARKYKKISVVIISCAVVNIALNLLLIPFFKGSGAAAVFLITNVVMIALYYRIVRKEIIKLSFAPLCFYAVLGVSIYVLTGLLPVNFIVRLLSAVVIYVLAAILFKQISRRHIVNLKALLAK